MTLAYGRQPDGSVALGSIDLLDPQRRFEILAITAKAAEGTGESIKDIWASLPHSGFDMVVMNPPFTRATGHEGEKIGVRNPEAMNTLLKTKYFLCKLYFCGHVN